tara:strand:+ start:14385 stop:14489 length:105 start_codon:yes stop_codon:yes gene_type:complete
MSPETVAFIVFFGPMLIGTTFSTICYLISGNAEI